MVCGFKVAERKTKVVLQYWNNEALRNLGKYNLIFVQKDIVYFWLFVARSHYISQVGCKFCYLSASASQELGLQVTAISCLANNIFEMTIVTTTMKTFFNRVIEKEMKVTRTPLRSRSKNLL